jgi:hypothetical protein
MDPTTITSIDRADETTLAEDRRIRDRWRYWLPWATLYARHYQSSHRQQFNPSYSQLDRLKLIHRRAVLDCISRGISWQSIRRDRIDDPRIDDHTRSRKIAEAVSKLRFTRRGKGA